MISVADLYGKEINIGDRVTWTQRARGWRQPAQGRSGIVKKITYGHRRYYQDGPIRCTISVSLVETDAQYYSYIAARTFVAKLDCPEKSEIATYRSWSLVNMTTSDKLAAIA